MASKEPVIENSYHSNALPFGATIQLKCTMDTPPTILAVGWLVADAFYDDGFMEDLGVTGSQLNLTVDFDDKKIVQCYFKTMQGALTSYTSIFTVAQPHIKMHTSHVFLKDGIKQHYITPGQSSSMSCLYDTPKGMVVNYYWNKYIHDDEHDTGFETISKQKNLSLLVNKTNEKQQFQCVISFPYYNVSILSEWKDLWVVFADITTNSLSGHSRSKILLREPNGLDLYCSDEGYEFHYAYRWLKNGQVYLKGPNRLHLSYDSYSLGAYQCQVRLGDFITSSDVIMVEFADVCADEEQCKSYSTGDCFAAEQVVKECPSVCGLCHNRPHPHVMLWSNSVNMGQALTLRCIASAKSLPRPASKFEWFKDGVKLSLESDVYRTSPFTSQGMGSYTCQETTNNEKLHSQPLRMLTDCEKLERDSPGGSSCLVACRMLIRSSLDEFTASHAIPLSRGGGLQYTNCRCSIVSDSESKQVIACEERKEVRVFESFRIKKQGDIISCRLHTKIYGEFVLDASLLWKSNELMNTEEWFLKIKKMTKLKKL